MIDWTRGYDCTWRFSPVDLVTWASKGNASMPMTASYTADSTSEALETASLTLLAPYESPLEYGWYRIEGLVEQGTSSELVTVATMRFDPDTASWSGGMRRSTLRGVSVLYPASEADALADGAWAARGSDGAARAAALLRECTPAPIVVEGSFQQPDTVVFDLDSKPLAAAQSLLEPAGWVARPDGRGEIHIMEKPSKTIVSFGAGEADLFLSTASSDSEQRITYTRAWGPGLRVYDLFTANLPQIGLSGTYRVVSQRVTCGKRLTVEETVEVAA